MNKLKRISYYYKISLPVVICFITNCGVKGKPLPPDYPPSIGRGLVESQNSDDSSDLIKKKNKNNLENQK